ncbi:MAG: penicillin-binding protein 2 [Paracoccaceae bacterium]
MRTPVNDPRSGRITRRGAVLLGLQLGVVGMLGWRLRQLQVEQSEKFFLLAEENRINIRLLPPERGLIFDRSGIPVAINEQNYQVTIVREQAGNVDRVLDSLRRLITIDEERRARVLREMKRRSAFVPVSVAEHLSWEEFSRVSVNAPALPGVITEVGLTRHYPKGPDFANIVGYVGPVSDSDLARLENPDPVLQIPKFQIGKTGIEKVRETQLRGHAGNSRIEVNSAGRVMRELSRDNGMPGDDLHLTVDAALQNYALKRMEGQSAAAVVIDSRNGDILCMASAPSFDPNNFVFGITSKDWNALLDNEYRPLSNKPVSGGYPPGSTFKVAVALAAQEAGLIRPQDTVWCPGYYQLGRRRFHCWKRGGHGHVNLHDSLKKSCDVFYYDTARKVGIDRIAAMARRLGLGVAHDLPIPAISTGIVPDDNWKRRTQNEGWHPGDTLNTGIGQGFVLASPLNLAVMTARIASGKATTPRLIRAVNGVPVSRPDADDLGVSEASLARVRQGMFGVSNELGGTAYRSRIALEEMALAGKTGTSQVRIITPEERRRGVTRNEDLPWNRRDHALFIAFAPYKNPRYAVSVVVEHGGGGSRAAAPIARDIMMFALFGPRPPLEAYPAAERKRIKEKRDAEQPQAPQGGTSGRDRA